MLLIILNAAIVLNVIFSTTVASQDLNIVLKKKAVHPKIEGNLLNLEKEYKKDVMAAQMLAKDRNIKMDNQENVTVFLISKPGLTIDETSIQTFGAKTIKTANHITKAEVPINMLSLMADGLMEISFVKLPDKLMPLSVESEGVNLIGASAYHSEGYTGSGVKVAIIDVGFAELSSAISIGELPDNIIKVDCTGPSCVSTDFSSETENHGTAVAEIVHDMAPGVKLYLIKVGDRLDLKDAKDYAIENGIRIINVSGGFSNQNFYDGECYNDNAVCTANDAYANDILWVNAAGNQAKQHYEATFIDSDSDGFHNVLGSIETIDLIAYSGDTIHTHLTWNAWPLTDQDYDLLLLNSDLNLVAISANLQTGTQEPTEEIYYTVPATGFYHLVIAKYNATANHQLEVYSCSHKLIPSVGSSSLSNPADASGVLTVGSINYSDWTIGPQELYSSQGPTNDGRIKPDIMGPDSVNNYVLGTFFGTSAASPHVAGAAALILSKNPTYSASQLRDALTSLAIDMGSSGKDNIYGYGLLNLDESPIISSESDNNSGSNTFTSVSSSGGGGGGCFIAAAAYGSLMEPHVKILRDFRDKCLLDNALGKGFVKAYYRYSPPITDFISKHDNLRAVVRLSLPPVVGISWVALKIGHLLTLSLMLIVISCFIGIVWFRRRHNE